MRMMAVCLALPADFNPNERPIVTAGPTGSPAVTPSAKLLFAWFMTLTFVVRPDYTWVMRFVRSREPGAVDSAITDGHLEAALADPARHGERLDPGLPVEIHRVYGWAPPVAGATVQTLRTPSWTIKRTLLRVAFAIVDEDIYVIGAREASEEELADYG
jgi:hypothetical protein